MTTSAMMRYDLFDDFVDDENDDGRCNGNDDGDVHCHY